MRGMTKIEGRFLQKFTNTLLCNKILKNRQTTSGKTTFCRVEASRKSEGRCSKFCKIAGTRWAFNPWRLDPTKTTLPMYLSFPIKYLENQNVGQFRKDVVSLLVELHGKVRPQHLEPRQDHLELPLQQRRHRRAQLPHPVAQLVRRRDQVLPGIEKIALVYLENKASQIESRSRTGLTLSSLASIFTLAPSRHFCMLGNCRFMAQSRASAHRACRSDPQNPVVISASCATNWGDGLVLQLCMWTCRISLRASVEGRGKYSSRSKRPARRRAGSTDSILLVAPMTITPGTLSRPSIKARRVVTMLQWTWSFLADRIGARPSSSSKNIIDGLLFVALKHNRST
jgi:hypothetical protein